MNKKVYCQPAWEMEMENQVFNFLEGNVVLDGIYYLSEGFGNKGEPYSVYFKYGKNEPDLVTDYEGNNITDQVELSFELEPEFFTSPKEFMYYEENRVKREEARRQFEEKRKNMAPETLRELQVMQEKVGMSDLQCMMELLELDINS